jgi:hypothetical protein
MAKHSLTIILLVIIGLLILPGHTFAGKHGLLIGISDYRPSGLADLAGTQNDLLAMETILRDPRYGFAGNLTVLRNQEATHIGIKKAFANLADRVANGDLVYIHYSGHGSYTDNLNNDDGRGEQYDQTWISWGARSTKVEGINRYDILDDELNQWLGILINKIGSSGQLILVSDSCHSASVYRSQDPPVTRAGRADDRIHPLGKKPFAFNDLQNGIMIGAARDRETAAEFTAPDGNRYGLFTWHWARALKQADPDDSWKNLFLTVQQKVNIQRPSQLPQLTGELVAQPVFNGDFIPPPNLVSLEDVSQDGNRAKINAGLLAGVTKGSVFRFYDQQNPNQEGLPSLTITRVMPFESFGDISGTLSPGDKLVEVHHAITRLSTRVHVTGDFPDKHDRELIGFLRNRLRSGFFPGYSLAAEQTQASTILYIVRPSGADTGQKQWTTGASLPQSLPDQKPQIWVLTDTEKLWHKGLVFPAEDIELAAALLKTGLATINKVREIRLMAEEYSSPLTLETAVWDPVVQCEVNRECKTMPITISDQKKQKQQSFQLRRTYSIAEMSSQQIELNTLLTFRLKNQTDTGYYAYLLHLDPVSGRISAMHPHPGIETACLDRESAVRNSDKCMIGPGEMRASRRGYLVDKPVENIFKLISTQEPIDINMLRQTGLKRGKARQQRKALEALLANAMQKGDTLTVMEKPHSWGGNHYLLNIRP